MPSQHFDPVRTTLYHGVNLIEASAGTGKTYAIAMLALRFVVEQNIRIERLLVVTFTRAATEELKDRIRARLLEAKRAVVGNHTNVDSKVIDWLQNLQLTAEHVEQRLDDALLNIDQASIFTIHGFCQRVLQEYPLESGQLFTSELVDSIQPIKQQCADDFWRRTIYPRSLWEAAVLTARYKTPDELLASVDTIAAHVCVYPAYESLDTALLALKQHVDIAATVCHTLVSTVRNAFADGVFKGSYLETFDSRVTELQGWLQGHNLQLPSKEAFVLLTALGLKEALNGQKFRANKNQTSDDRKNQYLYSLGLNTDVFDQLAMAINRITLLLRRSLLEYVRVAMPLQLQQHNVMSFDELITRLADSLKNDDSDFLVNQLRQHFSVALIDEFQDTDDNQWLIFSRIFAIPTHYLYLIGDPKQAIYKFRGADIYSYLSAQKTAEHVFTLASNWRSHPQLVSAVNRLFQRANPFFLQELSFTPVEAGLSAQHGQICYKDQVLAPMMLWQMPPSDAAKGYWTAGKAASVIRDAVVSEIINLLTQPYTLNPSGRKIQPTDIAILVRSNQQADEYQQALRTANIPSVLNSMQSVFATQDAIDLYTVLRAIAQPGDITLFKQAMTLHWFALDGQAFYRFMNDETAVEQGMERIFMYHQEWQKSGLMAMMQQVMAQEKIKVNLSTHPLSERHITNIQHLLELIQQAAVDKRLTISKTVEWLQVAITQASSGEDQQLRLESDDNAVRIVTTHRSKGLEYNIVFCPYMWQRKLLQGGRADDLCVMCHEQGQMVADLGSDDYARRHLQALDEELAEDLRVLYVALTRAKYRCYLVWSDVRTAEVVNHSALAWLLECAAADFSSQQTFLKTLKTDHPQTFDYHLLEFLEAPQDDYQKSVERTDLSARKRTRSLYSPWQMSSYTALSVLTVQEVPEFTDDSVDASVVQSDAQYSLLPRGVQLGNVVHELLESNSFRQLAEHKDISVQKTKLCLRYGLKLEQPELLDTLLYTVVTTPLSASDQYFCLMNVQDYQCLKEVPFYLALNTLDTTEINAILGHCPVFQPLSSKQIAGYLTGFIDLICEYQGRYYLMDYKTNTLFDYGHEALMQAMREHNYGLQYWLYSLVLHRYLQVRLPDYTYQQHFGGVRYLFVRGMQTESAMQGVYEDRPALDTLNALAKLFAP